MSERLKSFGRGADVVGVSVIRRERLAELLVVVQYFILLLEQRLEPLVGLSPKVRGQEDDLTAVGFEGGRAALDVQVDCERKVEAELLSFPSKVGGTLRPLTFLRSSLRDACKAFERVSI